MSSIRELGPGGNQGTGWGGSGSGGGPREEAILYEQPGFRGRSGTVTREASNLRDHGFNARAMSIRIRRTWQPCSDASYRGQSLSVQSVRDDLGRLGISRNTFSLRRER